MQGAGSKAQKDKPEGQVTPWTGAGCALAPLPPRGASEDPLDRPQPSLGGGRGCRGRGESYFLWCVIKLFPSCSNGGVPNCNSKRPKQ